MTPLDSFTVPSGLLIYLGDHAAAVLVTKEHPRHHELKARHRPHSGGMRSRSLVLAPRKLIKAPRGNNTPHTVGGLMEFCANREPLDVVDIGGISVTISRIEDALNFLAADPSDGVLVSRVWLPLNKVEHGRSPTALCISAPTWAVFVGAVNLREQIQEVAA
jgi:hypothetical protein